MHAHNYYINLRNVCKFQLERGEEGESVWVRGAGGRKVVRRERERGGPSFLSHPRHAARETPHPNSDRSPLAEGGSLTLGCHAGGQQEGS